VTENIEKLSIQRITREGRKDTEDIVTRELPLTIILNNQELVTLLCSPVDLKYLAIGFLSSEGLLETKDEVEKITVDGELMFKRMITSGCGRGASFYSAVDVQGQGKVESRISISAPEIFALVKEFQHRSEVYRTTGGVHSAALCSDRDIVLFSEDIGRHNAIDKIFGQCILEDIPTDDRVIITSGRISSEILLKVARRNIPILISKSAPTSLGVRLAHDLGVTLVGFVRGARMNIYTHGQRIVIDWE